MWNCKCTDQEKFVFINIKQLILGCKINCLPSFLCNYSVFREFIKVYYLVFLFIYFMTTHSFHFITIIQFTFYYIIQYLVGNLKNT